MKNRPEYIFTRYIFPLLCIAGLGIGAYFYENFRNSRQSYLKAKYFLERKDFFNATVSLKEAIRLDNNYHDAWLLYAKIQTEIIKDYNTGLTVTSQAFSSGCSGAVLYFLEGKCLYHTGKHKEAITSLKKSISIAPAADSTYYYLGLACFSSGNYKEAAEGFSSFIGKDSQSREAFEKRGDCYLKLGKHQLAATDYGKAIDGQKSAGNLYYRRALCYLALGDTASACTDLAGSVTHGYDEGRTLENKVCR